MKPTAPNHLTPIGFSEFSLLVDLVLEEDRKEIQKELELNIVSVTKHLEQVDLAD